LLVLSWKIAGYYGLDHWLLPLLGTPWPSDESAPADQTAAA
jgi:thiosulfate dehydrogenase [quinone] large subunit